MMSSKGLIRSRWAAIGAAVAVTLGGGGLIGVSAASGDASSLKTVTPARLMDTRVGSDGKVSGETVALQVTGSVPTYNADGTTTAATVVPAGSNAVALNLTVTEGERNSGYGFVTAYPCTAASDDPPNVSTLNFIEGVDVANSTVVPLGATGKICLNVYGKAHLIVDVSGYADDAIDAYTKAESDEAIEYVATGETRQVTYSHNEWRIFTGTTADTPCKSSSVFNRFATSTSFQTTVAGGTMLGANDECDIEMNLTPPEAISGYTWRLKGVSTCLTGLSVLGDSHHIDHMLVEYNTLTNPSGFTRTNSYQTDAMVPQLILIIPTGFDVSDADVPVGTNCGFWQTEHMPTLFSADLDDEDFVEQEGAQNYAISFRLSESQTGTVGIQEQTTFHDVTATWYAVADA